MATFIKGGSVANATSYELYEKRGDAYTSLATNTQINFEVSALGLAAGAHTLVVKAKADGYEDSDYSNEVVFEVAGRPITPVEFTYSQGFVTSENHSSGYGKTTSSSTVYTSSVFEVKAGQTVVMYACFNANIAGLFQTDASGKAIGTAALITFAEGTYTAQEWRYTATEDMYCRACNQTSKSSNGVSLDEWTISLEG